MISPFRAGHMEVYMVIIHIANIDTSTIGGVQFAVPEMIKAQSQYATVGLINSHGHSVDGVQMLTFNEVFDVDRFPEPFNKPDIVIFHELYRFEYIRIYRSLIEKAIPYVIIPHGCFSKKAQKKKCFKKFFANLLFFNAFIKASSAIQYLSDNERKLSAFGRYPSFVAGNGVALQMKKKEVTLSEDSIKIVYIGRLEMHIKGLDLLLKAVKKCDSFLRDKNVTVEIYGPNYENAHKKILRLINNLKIGDLVRLDKEKTGIEKEEILLSSDCFIQTSRTEGLPVGVLETLSYGVPCIVTLGTGLGHIIEKYQAGWVSPTNVLGIADSICKAIEEKEFWPQKASNAETLIRENYLWQKVAKEMVDAYREITGGL